ncbi:MAG: HAD hydrolase family protein, partial [Longimicrobiales bacterium]|nr:HAD hydrolase family protein [Longimicrobiales bacterium]
RGPPNMTQSRAGDGPGPSHILAEEMAKKIKLVVLDVDGVLTDSGVYMGALPDGESLEMKRFDIRDGLGMKLLQWAGIEVAVVSGRVSQATAIRARELGVVECHQDGGAQKIRAIKGILERLELDWDQVAMLGDDLPDLAVLRRVGVPAVVADATPEVRRVALWQGKCPGGRGAVREFSEAILRARGDWDALVEDYVTARSGEGEGD